MMKKFNISEHKDEIILHIIKNLIWIPIAAIIPLVNKLLNILRDNIIIHSEYITFSNILIVISVLLSAISIITSIYLLKKNNKAINKEVNSEKIDNKKEEISCDYRFSSIVAELTFDDNRKNITSTIAYKMTVLAESVNELKRDIVWSGSKYNGTKLTNKNGDYELLDSDRNHSPYPYSIVFNSEKKRGDKIEFTTETSVVDENLDMLPQYSFMAKYQIDKLIIRVIAPRNMIKNVKKSVYADRAKGICIESPQGIGAEYVRNLVRYTYEITNPTLLYNYFIEWEFTN